MAEYLRYVIKNIEPLRIADDSISQNGQTATLRYIPGSTIRGLIVNALSREDDFEEIKKKLFSLDVRYLNAYLFDGERELIPSPKGFYEDKSLTEGKKEIENVVLNGTFTEGNKRAGLGRYCYIEEDCIYYYNVDTDSDMKIKINLQEKEKKNVFRNEYIVPNQQFIGYIAVEDNALKERIKDVFTESIIIGNGRSAGMGKCQILSCAYSDQMPYAEYHEQKNREGACYMMLLSNATMRNEQGEYCGIDEKKLGELLGVENLEIEYCSTSTVDVKGFNRVWGGKIPSVVMYEQGSVFRLKFDGILSVSKMKELMKKGIGIRKNEGFGQVLFLDVERYENVSNKLAGVKKDETKVKQNHPLEKHAEDKKVLQIAAKAYYKQLISDGIDRYIVKNAIKKGSISNSQLGIIESFTTAYQYDPEEGIRSIKEYFKHANEKEDHNSAQKERKSVKEVSRFVDEIIEADLEVLLDIKTKNTSEIMGLPKSDIFSEKEIQKVKLRLLTGLIRYDNKKEVR